MENQQHYEAYQRALKEGVAIPLKYLKVLFFGPPRTGKTSMRRRLVGEIQNLAKEHLQASTGTAERFDVIVKVVEEKITTSTTVVTKSSWSTVKALFGKKKGGYGTLLDEELLLLYEFIYGVVERRNPVSNPAIPHDEATKGQSLKTDTVPSPASVKPSKTIRSSGSLFQELPSVEKPGYGLSDNEVEKVFEAFTKVLQTPRQKQLKLLLDGTVLLNMVDTGGQPAFLEMLPALTIGPALYLIFFRLDQGLNERYQIQFVSEDNKDIQLGESSYTVVEVIFQALSSIACFSCPAPRIANMPNPSHVAMFVGTHKDLLSGELEIKVKDGTLQENLKEVLDTDLFKADKNFLRYASNDQLMFAIDNMTGDEEELKKVRKRLEQVIQQEFDDFPIPASWLMFSIFLRKMGKRTLSLLQCKEIAGRLKVKNTDEALWFLHHCVGTLMYFPDIEELKDVVICDPQLIFDSVTDLILNSFKFDLVRKLACDKFNNAGMFRFKDIQKIARDSKSDSLPLPKLVKLLEYLNIIASIKPESPSMGHNSFSPDAYQEENLVYFMPAVLKNANEEELRVSQSPTDPAPLMIQFKCGFVPVGVFCAIIASLVAKKHTIQWILLEPCRNDGYILCKNRVTFRINDGGTFDITLLSKPKRYEIHIARISSVDITVEICQHVLETFCDTLDQVISKMKYKQCLISSPNPSDQTLYELGFKCPEHPCDDHLVVNRPKIERVEAPPQSARLKGKSTMVCLKEERAINCSSPHFAQKISPWFGEVMNISPVLSDPILDAPHLPKVTISHLQLITYGHHSSNKQALRLLQRLAPQWRNIGEILGLHGAVIETIENPGSGTHPEDCMRKVFTKWLENAPQLPRYSHYPLTWRGLHNLLLDSEHSVAATELMEALRTIHLPESSEEHLSSTCKNESIPDQSMLLKAMKHKAQKWEDDPQLKSLVKKAEPTGRQLGAGAYGSVEQVKIEGVMYAAKRLKGEICKNLEEFYEKFCAEFRILLSLHHPNVVQYQCICLLPKLKLPALVMEEMWTNLHNYLLNPSYANLSLNVKGTILHDIAKGLAYLHNHKPAVIHQDLTAKNVLLNSDRVAKISDFGNSRIINSESSSELWNVTNIPGTTIYMPPEASSDRAKFNEKLDIFSFGHLALFTATQVFPCDLLSVYDDDTSCFRTEVERRQKYIDQLEQQLDGDHDLVKLIKQCLHNNSRMRPTADDIVGILEKLIVATHTYVQCSHLHS